MKPGVQFRPVIIPVFIDPHGYGDEDKNKGGTNISCAFLILFALAFIVALSALISHGNESYDTKILV